jgi:hypothetical protein
VDRVEFGPREVHDVDNSRKNGQAEKIAEISRKKLFWKNEPFSLVKRKKKGLPSAKTTRNSLQKTGFLGYGSQ